MTMIDEKKIEEAADKAFSGFQLAIAAFYTGITWFKKELWHDISECNKQQFDDNATVLAYSRDKVYYAITGAELWADQKDYTRWCYIDDLLR